MTYLARGLRQRQTKTEEVLWQRLRNRKCGGFKFTRQFVIGRFITDFYCSERKLVVEVYGSVHADPDQKERDSIRTAFLEEVGNTVMVVLTKDIIQDVDAVCHQIIQKCHELSPLSRSERGRG